MPIKTWNLLIIDNDPLIGQFLQIDLSRYNFQVNIIDVGSDIITEIEKVKPGFILLNSKLNNLDGNDLLETISSEHPEIPVILLVGYPELDGIFKKVNNEIYDFIIKPFKSEQVRLVLERAIREIGYREQIRQKSAEIDRLSAENNKLQDLIDKMSLPPKPGTVGLSGTKIKEFSQNRAINTYRQHSGEGGPKEEIDSLGK